MELGDAGLQEQPFRASGPPLAVSAYAGFRNALTFLSDCYEHKYGLGLLQGPTLSGKSTVIKRFIDSLDDDIAIAVVDGKGLTAEGLYSQVLAQFGYELTLPSVNELAGMLRVVAMQQTAAGSPPLLVLENCQHLDAPLLRHICEIADLKANRQSALRIVMVCERGVENLINAPELQGIASRLTSIHRLKPMTLPETRDYLHAKLYAAGSSEPSSIISDAVCVDIYTASGGWPGIVDRLAAFGLARSQTLPISADHIESRALPEDMRPEEGIAAVPSATGDEVSTPRLYLSANGKLLEEIDLEQTRLLIGRSGHNDLPIDSRFVSRHHALIVSQGRTTLLMDLNSTNGTFVNSRRVSNHVLRHDDVISIGNHRIKFVDPRSNFEQIVDDPSLSETVILKTFEDMRHMLAGESTQTLPITSMGQQRASGESD